MPSPVEFWFDLSSPYAYLAASQLEALEARTGAEITLKPFSLAETTPSLSEGPQRSSALTESPSKAQHARNDLYRFARSLEVSLAASPRQSGADEVALRSLMVVEGSERLALAQALFRAKWSEGRDLGDETVLQAILRDCGLDGDVLERAKKTSAEAALRQNNREAIDRAIFDAPAYSVKDELFVGLDRIHFVEMALGGKPICPYPDVLPAELRPVDVWFDYSSPFAYVGVNRALAVLGASAQLKPMLLGAVFKKVGQAMVPMFEFSDARRAYFHLDITRQAADADVPFSFPSNFPINSVRALRVTLLARGHEKQPELVKRIFRAYWAEDQDISQPEVLAQLANELGFEGAALVEQSGAPEIKQALFGATDEAVQAGVFGAPTYIVHRPDGGRSLYWGSDRFHLAAQAAAGHTAVY